MTRLAEYEYDERLNAPIKINLSRTALRDKFLASAEVVHEFIHYFLLKDGMATTIAAQHMHRPLTANMKKKGIVYSEKFQDLIAGVIELRFLITAAYLNDIGRNQTERMDTVLGTRVNRIMFALMDPDNAVTDVDKLRLAHMVNIFRGIEGAPLEKQIAALQSLIKFYVYAAEPEEHITSSDIKDIGKFIREMEDRIFVAGSFDERLAQIERVLLGQINTDIKIADGINEDRRAVIVDSVQLNTLDASMVEALVTDERRLFAYSNNELYEVTVRNGVVVPGLYARAAEDLNDAVNDLRVQGFEKVSIITAHPEARQRFGKEVLKRDDVLLFSTSKAHAEFDKKISDLFALESFILPFAFTMEQWQLRDQSGVNRMFHDNGRIFALNPSFVANFGETIEASLTRIMDSIKTAVAEIHAYRVVKTAA